MADVAWVGQDGNLWFKGSQGVQNWGSASGYEFNDQGLRSLGGNALAEGAGFAPGVVQIADPNVPATRTPAPTGGTVAPAKVLNQAAINNTQATIDQLPALLQAALEAENTRFWNSQHEFNTQRDAQQKTYQGSTVTNQQNYDANFMDSIRSGIKGLGGLMSLLRGTGAAGGTVEDEVRDTVGGVTSNDIREGADTRNENQGALDSSLSTFMTELDRKRRAADDTKVNNERAVRRDTNTQLQDLYGKMAGYYGEADRTADANSWMARAGALTPEIAANSRTQISPYDTAPVTVAAPQLTAFAPPTQPSYTTAPANQEVGSGIFTMTDRRRKENATPLTPPALVGV